MKKPRLFIGSSVEGLCVAYAIQDNLNYSAEVTVWDQGVFNLSESTIESLITTIENTDFGVFVFTPDDFLMIRGKKNLTVRDNVLFELGLFIGKIGRNRSFIVIPDNTANMHLPTDLLGITTAKYETNRSDGNLKAGTGSLSNKIRESIKKLGFLMQQDIQIDTVTQINKDKKDENEDWFEEISINKNYEEGIKKLQRKIKATKSVDDKVSYEAIISFCHLKIDYAEGIESYEKLILKYPNNNIVYKGYAQTLMTNNNYIDALKIIEIGLVKCDRKIGLKIMKSDCYWFTNKKAEAIDFLKISNNNEPEICKKLAGYFSENKELELALAIAKEGYRINPQDDEMLDCFAKIAFDMEEFDLSLFLYNELTKLTPNSQKAWCMLGNSYYHNNLHNSALIAYEKANELANEKENWILENIGNLYINRGLFTKAESFLTRAIKIFDKSEYGLKRLSSTYESIDADKKKTQEIIATGKAKLSN